jgi:hypothetical protein
MFEADCNVCKFMTEYSLRALADIDEADFDHQPLPGVNTPRWILGHLAVSSDYALQAMGQTMRCPKEWHKRFGPGSQPVSDGVRPTKDELIAAVTSGYSAACAASGRADPAVMARPHAAAILKDTPIRTIGDLVTHLLTTHIAFHLGQLSAWRRQMGRSPMY